MKWRGVAKLVLVIVAVLNAVLLVALVVTFREDLNSILLSGDYEMVEVGGNSILHQGGAMQLWYVPRSGKRTFLWGHLVSQSPQVLDDTVVFISAGLMAADLRSTAHSAVLAFRPGGAPVEITEMVTMKYCAAQRIPYASAAGKYGYGFPEIVSEGVIRLQGVQFPHKIESPYIDVEITQDEVDQWIKAGRKNGTKKTYRGSEYLVPDLSAEVK